MDAIIEEELVRDGESESKLPLACFLCMKGMNGER